MSNVVDTLKVVLEKVRKGIAVAEAAAASLDAAIKKLEDEL